VTTGVDNRDTVVENLREQQRATSHVMQTLARFQGPRPVFDAVVEAAVRLCDGEYGALYIEERGAYPVVAAGGPALAIYDDERDNPIRPGRETIVGRIALTHDVCHIADVQADPEYAHPSVGKIGLRALAGVPIFLEDELIGVLAVARNVPEPFSDAHVDLLKTFADQAAIAIGNARLIDSVERQLEQQEAMSHVLRAIALSESLEDVFQAVVEAATRLCRADFGALYLRDGEVFRLSTRHDWDAGLDEFEREHPHVVDRTSAIGRVALTRDVVHIPDVKADPEYEWGGRDVAEYHALLAAPVIVEEELIGALDVTRRAPGAFADEEVRLLRTFADQAAIAIGNARLVESLEHQLDQQRAVSDVLGVVARSGRLEAVFDAVVEAAARLCHAEYGQLHVAEGDAFWLAGDVGNDPRLTEFERNHPNRVDRTTVVGRVALTQNVVHIPDVLADPEYSWPGQEIAGYRAMLGVPIFVDDELMGVINVVRNEAKPFTDEHIELVRTFADQAAIAIANARLLDAVERQRTELSRFVSPQVAELVSSKEGEKLLGGHRAYISCLFCDLRGFTGFTQMAEPEELFEVLREYHSALGELIPQYEGTLEHFAGDGVMVFFNDPLQVEQHELKAVQLGLAAQERLAQLAEAWRKRGTQLALGIGISAGYATLGRIGFEGRYDYGALGPATNLASRLSTAARPGQILISQRVFAAVEEHITAEPVGEVELKGFAEPVAAYDVRGLR